MVAQGVLAARFVAAGIDLNRPIVATCASGITSCMIALGLYSLGLPQCRRLRRLMGGMEPCGRCSGRHGCEHRRISAAGD